MKEVGQSPRLRVIVALALTTVFLSGCGSHDSQPELDEALEGRFIDAAVEGLSYRTATIAGITGQGGVFRYRSGETVEFALGDVVLGRAAAAPVVTPLSLFPQAERGPDDPPGNVAQLLQSLDDDAQPENGILITAATRAAAVGRHVNFAIDALAFQRDAAVTEFVAAATASSSAGARVLIDRSAAIAHLNQTIKWQPGTACTQSLCARVVQMWSGQFPLVVTNGYSDQVVDYDAGHAGNRGRYILMAPRQDNVAWFKVAVVSQGNTARALVRLGAYLPGAALPTMMGTSYPLRDGLFEMALNLDQDVSQLIRGAHVIDLRVFAGPDTNADNELGADEFIERGDWTFKLVTREGYSASRDRMALVLPVLGKYSGGFLRAFLTGEAPEDFPPRVTASAVGADQWWQHIRAHYQRRPEHFKPESEIYPFSHRTGIDFRTFDLGMIGTYFFDETSDLAKAIRNSDAFKTQIIEHLVRLKAAGLTLPSLRTAVRFDLPDLDLYGAFGTLYVDAALAAGETCVGGQRLLTGATLLGNASELYDWNYGDTNEVFAEVFPALASIQAGHGTLGGLDSAAPAGQVYTVTINLGAVALPDLEGRPLGECRPVTPIICPSFERGTWSTTSEREWICHGHLAALSGKKVRNGTQSVDQDASCRITLGPPITRHSPVPVDWQILVVRDIPGDELPGADLSVIHTELAGWGTISAEGRLITFDENAVAIGYADGVGGRCVTKKAVSRWFR